MSPFITIVPFGGAQLFGPKATKAQILEKLGRSTEVAALMKEALPLASMQEIHDYARSLLAQKKVKEALEAFQLNDKQNLGQFTTLVGLTRGYLVNGDFKNALKYAEQALPRAPDSNNKNSVTAMIDKLKKAQDVN